MTTLLSPGVSITLTNDTVSVGSGPGTTPLIVIATRANKLLSDGITVAPGTTTSGTMYLSSGRQDLVSQFGNAIFEIESGTPVQGSEISEYGLSAAYDYLGIANSAYVVRANIDLAQLAFSQTPPTANPPAGSYWFNLGSTNFGVFRANGSSVPGLAWTAVTPLLPTAAQCNGTTNAPLNSFGTSGNLAVVTSTNSNTMFENINGTWYAVGSTSWQSARPTVVLGTTASPVTIGGDTLIVNGITITLSGTSATSAVGDIAANAAAVAAGISGGIQANKLQITVSTGVNAVIAGSAASKFGFAATTAGYNLVYAPNYNVPSGAHSGDIWIKTTNVNYGANYVVELFSSVTNQWTATTAPLYDNDVDATAGYASALAQGSIYVQYNALGTAGAPIASSLIKIYAGTAWQPLVYTASTTAPTVAPAAGTLWISNAFQVDVMINSGAAWQGLGNALPATDPVGVQITSAQPTTQSTGAALVSGDLWLNSADVLNYPALYRYNATTATWSPVSKTDSTTPFGMIFADARNTVDGSQFGSTSAAAMRTSNYVDADAPNPQTYPAGMILFNTRLSTYNVKSWNPTYFATQGTYTVGTAAFAAPSYVGRWVTASGNRTNGAAYMGRYAQHIMVVKAMRSVLENTAELQSEFDYFNLLAAPGYPELDIDLKSLNVSRKETAFCIFDTPMHLNASSNSIQNWATNAANATETNGLGRTQQYTFAAEYYPHGLGQDYLGNAVVIPSSSIALSTIAYSDSVGYVWLPPAGIQRGQVQNASSVGYVDGTTNNYVPVKLNQGQRDTLYVNDINPIAQLPTYGLVVYGDKTLELGSDALSRINVGRLICFLRYQLDILGKNFLFKLNLPSTRAAAQSVFSRYLSDLMSLGAITDFVVECDGNNNTTDTVAANELWIDIAIVPASSIDFVYIPIALESSISGI